MTISKFFKKYHFFEYGTIIPNLKIDGKDAPYPVVNERAVRAGAGIMFALAIIAFMNAFLIQNYFLLKIVVVLFFIDFLMKVFIGIRFSPITKIANFIVRKQKPEFVGAVQKRFAWSLGLLLSGTMVLLLHVFKITGYFNLSICLFCLSVMWLEVSFGICVGCKVYYGLMRKGLVKTPAVKPVCPGGACPRV